MKKIIALIATFTIISSNALLVDAYSNNESQYDILDVIQVKNAILNGDYHAEFDTNEDGKITNLDLLVCKKSLLDVSSATTSEFTYSINAIFSYGNYDYSKNDNNYYIVTSYDELVELESNRPIFEEQPISTPLLSDTYGKDYFEDNVLCIALSRRASGSYSSSVDSVTCQGGVITMDIGTYMEKNGTATCDLHIDIFLAEIPKACYNGETFEVTSTDHYYKNFAPKAEVITGNYSYGDNSQLIKSYEDILAFESEYGFSLPDTYNESYFENKILYVQGVSSLNSDSTIQVSNISCIDDVITIYANVSSQTSSTDDTTEHIILFSIPKYQYADETFQLKLS